MLMLDFVALRSEPIRRIGEGRRLEVETVEETGDSITSVVFANVGKAHFFFLIFKFMYSIRDGLKRFVVQAQEVSCVTTESSFTIWECHDGKKGVL